MERTVTHTIDDTPHTFLGIVHNVAHIGTDRRPAELRNDTVQFLHTLLVGRDLRGDIRDIHVRTPRRIARTGQQRSEFPIPKRSPIDQ